MNFLIAPDFPPEYFAGWHLLNAYLQRETGLSIHLITPSTAEEEAGTISADIVDIIYANPFDASNLIYQKGYVPLVRPINLSDEMVIATSATQSIQTLSDLKPGMRVLYTENRDVKLIGLRLLESVDLNEGNLEWVRADAFQAVARHLIDGKAEFGMFLSSAYWSLTELTRSRLRLLIESRITDISHVVLLHPRHADKWEQLVQSFIGLVDSAEGRAILSDLGMQEGFEVLTDEDTDFMIDLMETLLD